MSSLMPWEDMKLDESVRVVGKQPPINETATAAPVRERLQYEKPVMHDGNGEIKDKESSFGEEKEKITMSQLGEARSNESATDAPVMNDENEEIQDRENIHTSTNGMFKAAPVREDLEYEKTAAYVDDKKKEAEETDDLEEKSIATITEADKLLNNDIASKTGNDVVEPKASKTWPPKFHIYDLLLAIVSFFTFAVDYGTDVILIVEYYINSEIVLFIISLCFIALPSIVSGIISAIWHRAAYVENNKKFKDDEKDDTKEREWKKKHQTKSKKSYIMMTLLSFVQLGRLARQFQYLILIGNSIRLKRQISKTENKQERAELERKDRNLRNRAISEKRDTAMLGLIDGFLESALQLVLQLYLAMLLSLPFHPLRVGSLIASLVSTSLIHTSYYRTNRRATQKKESVSYFSAIFYFLMRLSELGPRYLLLAMFCVVFRPWSFIAIPVHMLFVLVLYKSEKPSLEGICPTESGPCLLKSLQHLFVFMMSYLGLFSFVNLFEGKTRRPAAIFYSVFYVENIVMTCLLLWYLVTYNMYVGWVYVLWAMPIGLVCHAISGTLFYEVFHPNIWNARFPNFCKCRPPCCKEISED